MSKNIGINGFGIENYRCAIERMLNIEQALNVDHILGFESIAFETQKQYNRSEYFIRLSNALYAIENSDLNEDEKRRLIKVANRMASGSIKKPRKLTRLFCSRGGVRDFLRRICGMITPVGMNERLPLSAEHFAV